MSSPPPLERYHLHERDWEGYEQLYDAFEWKVPESFNVATYACDRWADEAGRVALFVEDSDGDEDTFTFTRLNQVTNRLANYLAETGIERGDRVGVNLPQKPETIITHLAIWKLGAVSVPLSTLFGPNGLAVRLDDCSASACVVDESNVENYRDAEGDVESVSTVLTVDVDEPRSDESDFWEAIADRSREFETVETDAQADAIVTYTSGTTGDPKGVVHAHRVFLGLLPLFQVVFCDLEMDDGDVFWAPPEWAWFGILGGMVVPALYFGKPVLSYHEGGPFDVERALELVGKYGVTNPHFPPTVLRMMMQVDDPADEYDLDSVRVVSYGSEAVGEELVSWVRETFDGAALHEAFGQTEANGIVGECESLMETRRGTLGKPLPGHEVTILDPDTAEPLEEPDTVGEIAVRYDGDPLCMKEYWNRTEQTEDTIQNGWLLTDDLGSVDADGYISYHSRKDDVIISSGRRIGPGEIEDSLAGHHAVLEAGVIGIPHDERGEVPKAFVTLADGVEPGDDLRTELQEFVQQRLARYEYPHEIAFVDDLPKTTTGKVRRTELRSEAAVE